MARSNAWHLSTVGFVVGLGVAVFLVLWQGIAPISESLRLAGWGVLLMAAWYGVPLAITSQAWRLLFPRHESPRPLALLRANWIGLAVNWLLPVATIGGEFVKALIASRHGVAGPVAGASVVADKFLQAVSLLVWSLIGVGLLLALETGGGLIPGLLAGIAGFTAIIAVFYYVQQRGLFGWLARRVDRLAGGRQWLDLVGNATRLDAALRDVYRQPARVVVACTLRLAARITIAGEVWLAFYLIGHPISLVEAMVMESLSAATRAAVFFVPAGIGAQEGAFAILAHLLGFGADMGLAISLLKRVRELLIGVPALMLWHFGLSRRQFAGSAAHPRLES